MAGATAKPLARGFTLIELMVVIAIVAIVSLVALPNFQQLIRSNRVATQTNEMVASLSLARTEAIRRNVSPLGNRDVVLCPSTDGLTCSGGWNQGWIVAQRVDDAVDIVIRHVQEPVGVDIAAAGTEIVFDNRGRRAVGPAAMTVRSTACTTGQPYLRTLNINASGQVRVAGGTCP